MRVTVGIVRRGNFEASARNKKAVGHRAADKIPVSLSLTRWFLVNQNIRINLRIINLDAHVITQFQPVDWLHWSLH